MGRIPVKGDCGLGPVRDPWVSSWKLRAAEPLILQCCCSATGGQPSNFKCQKLQLLLSLFSLPACSHITVNHLTFLTSAFEKCVTITSWINLGILDLSHELMVSWKPQSCTSSSPHCLLVLIFRTRVPLAISFSSALLWPEKVQLTFNALGCPMLSVLGGGKLRSLQFWSSGCVTLADTKYVWGLQIDPSPFPLRMGSTAF